MIALRAEKPLSHSRRGGMVGWTIAMSDYIVSTTASHSPGNSTPL